MKNKTKKFLFIGPTAPPFGGVEAINELVLDSYVKDKYNIIHLNTQKERGTEYNNRFDVPNIKRALKHFFQLFRILLTEKIGLVYLPVSSTNSGFLRDVVFIIISRIFNKRIIGHLHGGTFDLFYNESPAPKKLFIRFAFRRLAILIVLTHYWKDFLGAFVPSEKIRIVYNAIDDKIMRFCEGRNYTNRETVNVLFMGNLGKRKGTFDILKTIPEVAKKRPDVKFIFAGTEEKLGEMKQIEEICLKGHLNPHIEFLGGVYDKDKLEAFRNADIFLLPSYNEGLPLAIIEAMSAGLPVITCPVGGIPDVVKDENNGFLIPPGDPKAIADRILRLTETPDLRKTMGKLNKDVVSKKFLKTTYLKQIDTIFAELWKVPQDQQI